MGCRWVVIEYHLQTTQSLAMKYTALLCALLLAGTADAACYVEYKAKKDNPLNLHYGFMDASDSSRCSATDVTQSVERRLARHGWTLLTILNASATPPSDQQREVAGDYFLRF